jgi:hypothetical protein
MRPLHVPPIPEHRDEIADDQERQHDTGRLLAAREDERERGDEQDPEARDTGLGDADHECAERGDQPLPGAETEAFV